MMEAYETNWMSTVGENINEVERQMAEYIGVKYAVGLNAGTAALHLATKLAGERLFGQAKPNEGTLQKKTVLCSERLSAWVSAQQQVSYPIIKKNRLQSCQTSTMKNTKPEKRYLMKSSAPTIMTTMIMTTARTKMRTQAFR